MVILISFNAPIALLKPSSSADINSTRGAGRVYFEKTLSHRALLFLNYFVLNKIKKRMN
jgi:hypothetical protein